MVSTLTLRGRSSGTVPNCLTEIFIVGVSSLRQLSLRFNHLHHPTSSLQILKLNHLHHPHLLPTHMKSIHNQLFSFRYAIFLYFNHLHHPTSSLQIIKLNHLHHPHLLPHIKSYHNYLFSFRYGIFLYFHIKLLVCLMSALAKLRFSLRLEKISFCLACSFGINFNLEGKVLRYSPQLPYY